jgi:superfamily I DNA and RNA helicase
MIRSQVQDDIVHIALDRFAADSRQQLRHRLGTIGGTEQFDDAISAHDGIGRDRTIVQFAAIRSLDGHENGVVRTTTH